MMLDILIVDDDSAYGQLTVDRLEDMGWKTKFHHGPFGTLNAIRAARPRLLIMDVNMPGLDGPSIHEMLRRNGELEHMKVLLVSSLDQRALQKLAIEHRIDAVLAKSATRTELRGAIRELIGKAGA